MSTNASADEQPKDQIAKQVVTEKRQYFEPHRDYVAESLKPKAQRGRKKKQVIEEEEGDA